MMTWRAIAEHTSAHVPAIRFERGEAITVAYRDARAPGWWWCTDKHGRSGWVHERFFEEDDYRFVGREEYDGRELTVRTGEQVAVLDICDGRALCRNAAGEIGWLPLSILEPVENT